MKPKTLILLVVAVGCGLAASFMTARLIADRSNDSQENRVRVLVAKKRINAWTLLSDKPDVHFIFKEIPESAVPKKALREFADLKDKRVNKPINEEAFVTSDDLGSKEHDGLAMQLPPGYRALAIRVTPESLAGGFVIPGSRVDVIATLREGRTRTRTIMQNMLVLAIDMASNRNPDSTAMLGSTATLAVRPEEAQRLHLASALGDLRLALRPVGEKDEPLRIGETTADHFDRPILRDPTGTGTGDDANVAGGPLPTVPNLPTLPDKIEAPKAEEKPEKLAERHLLKVINGDSTVIHTFTKDDKGGWEIGGAAGDERKPGRRPQAPHKPEDAGPEKSL
jgi:pilus assembly protein CpaB